jgi:hypothetical protein
MNLITRASACLACAALAVPALGWAGMEEGNWEVTVKMEMAGMPFPLPPTQHNQCVTKKDVVPDMSRQDQSCIVRDQKIVGDTVTWRVQCKSAEGTMDGEGRIKYAGRTYDGAMQARMTDKSGGEAMTIRYTMQGRHTGPCGPNSRKAKRADDS